MPETWTECLMAYSHPFDLSEFVDAHQYAGWFDTRSSAGDRAATMAFEARFREHAAAAIEPWLEVVFWEFYGEVGIRDFVTRKMASRLRQRGVSPQSLWQACIRYLERPSKKGLFVLKTALGLTWGSIAAASAFPAFMRPDWYPMVDTRVAKWVGYAMQAHNAADPTGPQLVRPPYLDSARPVLTTRDFGFVESWFRWCWHTGRKLSALTQITWRPRDVEMAVSCAWGGPGDAHPSVQLSPLPPRG
jgi:hypothetical protein